jgi:His-Xaa-Ser system protein HxsD
MNTKRADPQEDDTAFRLVDGAVHLRLHPEAYSLTGLQKTGYRFADRCTMVIGALRDGALPITLHFASGTSEGQALQIAHQFLRELVDQELRERLSEETRAMRYLLLAHTFSRTNLIRRDG